MPSVSIVGIGRVGAALALAITKAGYDLEYLIHRGHARVQSIKPHLPDSARIVSHKDFPRISSDMVIIATGDPEIGSLAGQLAATLDRPSVVLHVSGSLSSSVLAPLAAIGCRTGSMHPLISISDPESDYRGFRGAYFCVEGDDKAVEMAHAIVESIGGIPFSIPSESKALYHAAAVTACGHFVALIDVAIEMLAASGVDRDMAKRVLMPLIKSTVANLEDRTPAAALTGSFARADVGAFDRHMALIDARTSEYVREVYLLLGERSLDLAAANGADAEDIAELRDRISIAKRKTE